VSRPHIGEKGDEVVRVIGSLQLTAKHKLATPVNWKQGEDVIVAGSVLDEEARTTYPQGWKAPKILYPHPARRRGSGGTARLAGSAAPHQTAPQVGRRLDSDPSPALIRLTKPLSIVARRSAVGEALARLRAFCQRVPQSSSHWAKPQPLQACLKQA
jgi:C-terminal domain of 1-Cys peroxiredoxin